MNYQKIQRNDMTEKSYRAIPCLSYSALRIYEKSRRAFYKKYILNEGEDEKTVSTTMGSLVHALLLEPDIWEEKFVISTAGVPTGQLLELCNELYIRSLKSMDETGRQRDQFEVIFLDAVNKCKYDFDLKEVMFKAKSVEKIIEMFSTPDKNGAVPELYYKELLASTGKTVISPNMIKQAEDICNKLKSHPFTEDIINQQSTPDIEVYNELPIIFEYEGVSYKSLIDKVIVSHEDKTITPFDLKTSFSTDEGEDTEYTFLKNGYWIQACLYNFALSYWLKENYLEDYQLCPMQFIFADVANFDSPILLTLSTQDLLKFERGFKIGNRIYKGVTSILNSIAWHQETGIWTHNQKMEESKGIHKLNLNYE